MGWFEDTSQRTEVTNFKTGDFTAGNLTIDAAELANNSITETKLSGALITGTSNATPGTISTHAHGLSGTPAVVILTPVETSGGTAAAVALDGFGTVGKDATNVYAKSTGIAQDFEAYCLL